MGGPFLAGDRRADGAAAGGASEPPPALNGDRSPARGWLWEFWRPPSSALRCEFELGV